MILGEWGFPMTCRDLRLLIKAYLDVKGKSTRNESNYNTVGTYLPYGTYLTYLINVSKILRYHYNIITIFYSRYGTQVFYFDCFKVH